MQDQTTVLTTLEPSITDNENLSPLPPRSFLVREESWVGVDVNTSELMEEGEASSLPERVEVSKGEGSYQNAEKQKDENSSRMSIDVEDSSINQQGASEEKLSDPEDSTIQNPLDNIDGIEEETPTLTSESELEHSREILVPDDEIRDLEENLVESAPHVIVDEDEASASRDADEPVQEAIESPPFLEDGDHPERAPTDEQSPKVDDEGATTHLEKEKGSLESGSEDKQALPEIAEGLSEPPDTSTGDLDSVDLSNLLGLKPLDFEVIDFDQFGPQPPDLPLGDNLDNEEMEMKVNQFSGIGSPNGERGAGESTEVIKPEEQITDMDIDNADNGIEQEMKTLNDGPVKTNLKETSENEQFQNEQDPEPDMDSYHIVPNRIEELQSEDNLQSLSFRGAGDNADHDVRRDLDSKSTGGRNGTSELWPLETMNPENIGEAPSDRALRSLNSETEVEGSSAPEEIQNRNEEFNQVTQEQARQLEDIRHQVELSTAQLEEQSKIHEELKRELDAECDERLKSEAKLMVLYEILPNMEEKLKNLSNQVLLLEVQLQEQVDLRNKLEDDLQQERKERMQYVTQLEEQVDLKNKLAETLEQERKERMQYVAQLEEQTRLHEELAHKLDEERDGRLKSEADLMVLREMSSNAEEKLKDLSDQVESLVVQLREQTELRKGLEEKLDWECKERMQHTIKIEEQTKIHEELALKLEEERDERLKSETNPKELRESLSNKEEKLEDLHNQVVLLTAQLQEQIELKKELEDKLDQECQERIKDAVMVLDHSSESLPVSSMPWSEEKLELAKLLDEQKTLLANQVQEAENLKNAAQMKVGLLNHQVQNLEVLSDIAENMEHVFSAKERAIKQALWTAFQALCLGMGFMYFVVAYRDPLRSSLQPT